MFGNWFRRKDPVCGMREEKGQGLTKGGMWFCSETCLKQHEKTRKKAAGGCCGGH